MRLFSVMAALFAALTASQRAMAVYDVIVKPTVQGFSAQLQTSASGDYDGGSFYYHDDWGADSSSASALVRYQLPTLPKGERIYNVYTWVPVENNTVNFSVLTARADGVQGAGGSTPFINGWPGMFGQDAQWAKFPLGPTAVGEWRKMGPGPQMDEYTDGGQAYFLNPAHQIPGSGVFTAPEFYIAYQPGAHERIAFTSIRVVEVGVVGDFDHDGDADGNDFLEWQRGNGTHGAAVDPFEPLHPVDLLAVTKNFGTQGGPYPSATPIPEPATVALAALGLIGAGFFRGRRRI